MPPPPAPPGSDDGPETRFHISLYGLLEHRFCFVSLCTEPYTQGRIQGGFDRMLETSKSFSLTPPETSDDEGSLLVTKVNWHVLVK